MFLSPSGETEAGQTTEVTCGGSGPQGQELGTGAGTGQAGAKSWVGGPPVSASQGPFCPTRQSPAPRPLPGSPRVCFPRVRPSGALTALVCWRLQGVEDALGAVWREARAACWARGAGGAGAPRLSRKPAGPWRPQEACGGRSGVT